MAALTLGGCASQQPAPMALSQLPAQYSVSGRVAVNAAGKGYNARFSWSHNGSDDAIEVSNPLGQTMARLELSPGSARFFDGDGKLRRADDVETLSEQTLGWRLPATGLRYWLLGLPAPDTRASWRNEADGRILEQDGWEIRYPKTLTDNDTTPARMTLSRPDLEVRIALYDWQLTAAP